MSKLCKYCGGTLPTLYEGEKDVYTIDDKTWKCPVCGEVNIEDKYVNAIEKTEEIKRKTGITFVDMNLEKKEYKIATKCIICGEEIEISSNEGLVFVVKVCEKCKKAVSKMREDIGRE